MSPTRLLAKRAQVNYKEQCFEKDYKKVEKRGNEFVQNSSLQPANMFAFSDCTQYEYLKKPAYYLQACMTENLGLFYRII